ncbi:GH25 family lysozyme, partial [Collinsella bouchesdurhonensis]|uniref:GH25 family lysozyme n=1 Tax=Collinsella bouchesdurhonensis TaxID=1907654 RepID=UPI003F93CCA2
MNRFKHLIKAVVAIALTYVLCASALLQPMAVYAATLQAQQPVAETTGASSTQGNSAGDASGDADDEAGKDASSAGTAQDGATPADAADVDEKADGEDAAAPESLDTEDEQTADDAVIGDSEANSWRYQNGELRSDLQDDNATDLGIESRSMHEMPEGATMQGIDVSGYQKDIDWQKVKDAGIDFAILKIGNINAREADGWYTDSYFQRNVTECERLGIPYGVYTYSYAKNADDAVKGADHIIALLKGHNPTLPVYLDLEDDSIKDTDHAAIAKAFCSTISAAGYAPGIYASASWFKNILTDPCFSNSGWGIWTAQYWYGQRYDASLGLGPEYPAKFDCWQYSSLSTVPGIDGNCDINYWYKDRSSVAGGNPHIACRAHVAGIGWQAAVEDGATAGTTGRALALEALRVSLSSSDYDDGSAVEVDAHVSGIGWQGWDSPSPSEGGTTGQARAVEAVRLRLTGAIADDYDVWYRVHAAGIGWMGWAKDGEDAGTTGMSCPVEAVQVKLVRKGEAAPSNDDSSVDYAFKKRPMSLTCRAHVAGIGWQAAVEDGATAGTTGRALALEALRVSL